MSSGKNERPSVVLSFINLQQKGALITVSIRRPKRLSYACILCAFAFVLIHYILMREFWDQGLNKPYRAHYASEFLSKLFMFKYLSPRTDKKRRENFPHI
jgi:hypothetical protein